MTKQGTPVARFQTPTRLKRFRQILCKEPIPLKEGMKTPSGNNKFQMTNSKFSFIQSFAFLFFLVVLAVAGSVFALTKNDIVFPVAELGNCQSEQECRAYCDDSVNVTQCVAFAEKYSILSLEEIAKAKKFQEIGAKGPGGCGSERACEAYCSDISHIEECLSFAETHGFMEGHDLEEAKKVASALRQGAQLPGGCTNKDACESYCSDTSHMKECVEFAEKAGFMNPEELKEAKQVLKALDAGVAFPGDCKGKNECQAYCEDPGNMEECVNFGIAAGFIPPEEAEQVRRMIPLMKEGKMPEGCRGGREKCEAYCAQEENAQECTTFFVEAGFMTLEQAETFRKTGGKGPGGCTGQQECEAFCNEAANQETCFAFAQEQGLIPEGELQNIREGVGKFKEGISSAPPEVAQCLKEKIGQEVLDKIEAGTFLPNPQLGEQMKGCFEEFLPGPGQRQQGPGTAEECATHGGNWDGSRCDFGAKECVNQGGSWDGKTCNFPEGQFPGIQCEFPPCGPPEGSESQFPIEQYRGPGGCSTAEECQAYCQANPEECYGVAPPGGGPEYQTKPPESLPIENADQSSEECMKQGGMWDGARCDFGARECAKQGGSWTGSSCMFQPAPEGSSLIDAAGNLLKFLRR